MGSMKLSHLRAYFFPTLREVDVCGQLTIFSKYGTEHFNCTKRKGFWKKAAKYIGDEFAVKNHRTQKIWVLGYYMDANPMLTHELIDDRIDQPFYQFLEWLERKVKQDRAKI